MMDWIELSEAAGLAAWRAQALRKGAGHKYIRRVPKPGGGYRYYYRTSGVTRGVGADLVPGAKFKLTHEGQPGHFEVVRRAGDRVVLKHDESGASMAVSAEALGDLLRREHADVVQAQRERTQRRLDAARKHGSPKQIARMEAEARRHGVSEAAAAGDGRGGRAAEIKVLAEAGFVQRLQGQHAAGLAGKPYDAMLAERRAIEATGKTAEDLRSDGRLVWNGIFDLQPGESVQVWKDGRLQETMKVSDDGKQLIGADGKPKAPSSVARNAGLVLDALPRMREKAEQQMFPADLDRMLADMSSADRDFLKMMARKPEFTSDESIAAAVKEYRRMMGSQGDKRITGVKPSDIPALGRQDRMRIMGKVMAHKINADPSGLGSDAPEQVLGLKAHREAAMARMVEQENARRNAEKAKRAARRKAKVN